MAKAALNGYFCAWTSKLTVYVRNQKMPVNTVTYEDSVVYRTFTSEKSGI